MDWTRSATEITRRLRAYTPWPGLHTFAWTADREVAERIKILEAEVAAQPPVDAGEPGRFRLEGGRLLRRGRRRNHGRARAGAARRARAR